MPFLAKESISIVKSLLGGTQKANNYFTMLLTKNQLFPLPLVPMSIIATGVPGRSLGKISVMDMGTTYNIAGDTVFEDWKVTIRTFQYIDYRMIKSWFENIHSPMNGNRTSPKDYKSTCTVSQIDHRSGLPLTNFIIKGVFPLSVSEVTFSEDSNELIKFDVTFNVDDIIVL